MIGSRSWRGMACAIALAVLAATPGSAQEAYPVRPVRIIVPFSAGGTADVLGRLLAQRLTVLYGQQVIVDNRPGAGGNLGADLVAKAPPDGYTLLLGTIGIHAASGIYRKLPYDPVKDLQPITVLAELPCVVIVHPSLPVSNLADFIAYAQAHPGAVNFGSAGSGTSTHLTGELFKMAAGVNLTHVPYRGSAPALNDLVAGQIQAMFENLPTTPPHIRTGAVRALAVTSATRSPSLPEIPTVAEAGLPGAEATAWFTLAAPAGLPAPVLGQLSRDVTSLLALPEVADQIRELGATPVGGTPDQTARFLAAETVKWTAVIKTADIKVD